MNKSPLQLEHYTLAEISIKPYEGYVPSEGAPYPSFNGVDFASAVEFGPANREGVSPGSLWGIRLNLTCNANDGSRFPYQFVVGITGVFDGSGLPEKNRSDLVMVNGASLLYGVLRDEILRLTSRMHNGPLMLPTVQFTHLADGSVVPEGNTFKGARSGSKKGAAKTLAKG